MSPTTYCSADNSTTFGSWTSRDLTVSHRFLTSAQLSNQLASSLLAYFSILIYKVTYKMSLASVGYRTVENIVQNWSKKYHYHISLLESVPSQVRYMVEFSLTNPEKPIPGATIRVYFICRETNGLSVTFRFQKDSLIHSASKTIRHSEFEEWLDAALAKKLLVRETVFYLGTAYESTRVKNQRQDDILREPIVSPQQEYVYLHPDLLSDQKRTIEIMETAKIDEEKISKQLKTYFYQVDLDGIGVITHVEFAELIKNIGLKLNSQEFKNFLKRVDPNQTGLVEYQDYEAVSREVFESYEIKKEAEAKLLQSREQQIFGSVLMLVGDEAQDIEESMLQRFKAKDEDEKGVTNISEVKAVLEDINKKAKEANKAEPLSGVELAEIAKLLTDKYGYKEIPYRKIHSHIIEWKIRELTIGRINSRMNNLEVHLRDIFDIHDDKKCGKIKLAAFQEALTKSDKIKITRAQIYLLKTILPVDAKGQINYVQSSKFLAEIIKKFYTKSSKKRD